MRATGARANGGAFPSDMYESGKRETDPIAFQIHFATGAWGEIMGAGGANLVDRYRREVLRLCGSVGIVRVSRFRGGRSGIRTVTRPCGVWIRVVIHRSRRNVSRTGLRDRHGVAAETDAHRCPRFRLESERGISLDCARSPYFCFFGGYAMTVRTLLPACIVVGVLVLVGMHPAEAADQPQQLKAACERGTPTACNALGLLHMKGEGVKPDETRAAAMFRKACDIGDPSSCSNLGVMYAEGVGVQQDDVQAAVFSRRACDGG